MAHNDKVLEAEGEGEVRAPPPAAPVPPGALLWILPFRHVMPAMPTLACLPCRRPGRQLRGRRRLRRGQRLQRKRRLTWQTR